MKKLFFMLIATICVAGAYAQNLQIWTENDIMYEQSVATIDSITFTQSSAPETQSSASEQEGTLYKTWEGKKSYEEGRGEGVRITLNQNDTFSYSVGQKSEGNWSWYNYGSGTFLRQGNLILLCVTSGTGHYLPTCLVYNNGKLYGGFGVFGSYELQ